LGCVDLWSIHYQTVWVAISAQYPRFDNFFYRLRAVIFGCIAGWGFWSQMEKINPTIDHTLFKAQDKRNWLC
jgi:hypothetical protein